MEFKVYVINLKKDVERLKNIEAQFALHQIKFTRIDAVNGKEIDFSEIYDDVVSRKENGYSMSPGEIGCTLSHKKTWEYFLHTETNIDYALICEDDIEIDIVNFKKVIEECVKDNTVKKIWEYLQFNYQKPGFPWAYAWCIQTKNTFLVKNSISKKGYVLIMSLFKLPFVIAFGIFEFIRNKYYKGPVDFYRDMYLAGCYLINKDGAQKLLSVSDKVIYPADAIHNKAKLKTKLQVRQYCPVIVNQNRDKFKTNIGSSS